MANFRILSSTKTARSRVERRRTLRPWAICPFLSNRTRRTGKLAPLTFDIMPHRPSEVQAAMERARRLISEAVQKDKRFGCLVASKTAKGLQLRIDVSKMRVDDPAWLFQSPSFRQPTITCTHLDGSHALQLTKKNVAAYLRYLKTMNSSSRMRAMYNQARLFLNTRMRSRDFRSPI